MAGRYDVERAVLASQLPVISRCLMLTLATRINPQTGGIPERAQPSLTRLAAMTGAGRTSVRRHLAALERAGWISRARPTPEAARRRHETTRYALTVPGQSWAQGGPSPGPGRPQSWGQDGPGARAGAAHKTDRATDSYQDDELAAIARDELAALTGRRVTLAQAAEAARLVLGGRELAHPAAYLRAALRADPARFAPPSRPEHRTMAEALAVARGEL